MRKRGVLLFCIIIFSIVCTAVLPVWADGEKVLAFPGAEGGGKYAMGARMPQKTRKFTMLPLWKVQVRGLFQRLFSKEQQNSCV